MMRLRTIVVAVALVSLVAMTATGTQSINSGELERGVGISVASDDDAYLGLSREVVTEDGQTLVLNVTNSVSGGQSLDVGVDVRDNGTTVTKTTTLLPGRPQQLEFTDVSCDATIDVVATGQAVRIELTRPVPCDSSTSFDDQDEDSQGDDQDGGDDDDTEAENGDSD